MHHLVIRLGQSFCWLISEFIDGFRLDDHWIRKRLVERSTSDGVIVISRIVDPAPEEIDRGIPFCRRNEEVEDPKEREEYFEFRREHAIDSNNEGIDR